MHCDDVMNQQQPQRLRQNLTFNKKQTLFTLLTSENFVQIQRETVAETVVVMNTKFYNT